MTRMYNPAHPSAVLKEYLSDVTVTAAAESLYITRSALSRILNGKAGITADMALRLESALGANAEMWLNLQSEYELWIALQRDRPEIKRMAHAALKQKPAQWLVLFLYLCKLLRKSNGSGMAILFIQIIKEQLRLKKAQQFAASSEKSTDQTHLFDEAENRSRD